MKESKPETRPDISLITNSTDLRRWYWLKKELFEHAKSCGLKAAGGKFTILDRIAHFLDTGETVWPEDKKSTVKSKFDWHKEPLSSGTIITDSYKNTQNVRRFFQENVDQKFKFNIEFMAWIKANIGKSLGEAGREYLDMRLREKQSGFQSTIADHNQFNQYTRDFLTDNPALGMSDVRRFWALKSKLPADNGRHIYERTDLELK